MCFQETDLFALLCPFNSQVLDFVFPCLEWLHFLKMSANVMLVTFVGGIKTALISFIEEFPGLCVSNKDTVFSFTLIGN